MFCSILNYGFFVTDRNPGNYLTYTDTNDAVYIYNNKEEVRIYTTVVV